LTFEKEKSLHIHETGRVQTIKGKKIKLYMGEYTLLLWLLTSIRIVIKISITIGFGKQKNYSEQKMFS
jgi:hypothetical protein